MIRCSCGNPLVSVEAICELCDVPVRPRTHDWLDEIEAQIDGTVPYYVPRLIAEIRRLRVRVR